VSTAFARMRSALLRPDVAIAHEFVRPPWGGSNQFLMALRDELRGRGLRVAANAISKRTRGAILNAFLVDERLLRDLLHPGCRVLHRVDGPVALYRGFDDGADERIETINAEFADATVFQSRFSLEAHGELGIRLRDPLVIPNAVDPTIFFPPAAREPLDGRRVRVVATSWSDNPNKGGPTFRWLDEHLDHDRYELTFVGRARVEFRQATVVPPVGQSELAEIIRRQDVYLAASLNDPCSNALLEALACGLPAVYARSGGHPELVGAAGLGYDSPEEIAAHLDRLVADYDDYRGRISIPGIAEVADRYIEALRLG
jgi:glycosyltransferase involved in cell wall biosynthesis